MKPNNPPIISLLFLSLTVLPTARAGDIIGSVISSPRYACPLNLYKNKKLVFEGECSMAHSTRTFAFMNIDGQNLLLNPSGKTEVPPKANKTGGRFTHRYRSGDTNVKIDYVITRVCKPKEQECESIDLKATISVNKGEREQQIQVIGDWGG